MSFPRITAAAVILAASVALSREVGAVAGGTHKSLGGETFVVDPGHGTRYPNGTALNVGAVGPGGVEERRVTLTIGEDLAALLRAAGARVILTRSYAQPYRVATDIVGDNRARAALANQVRATAFIALHADASLDSAAHGISVFWLHANSVPLANAIRAQLAPLHLGLAAFHARSLAVTRVATVPAVLVELGFITNPRDEGLLQTSAFQKREAQALFTAIAQTF
jgi:N-acetylmuramoyl-L-alanine amidase